MNQKKFQSISKNLVKWLSILMVLSISFSPTYAAFVGTPPIKEIQIPYEPYSTFFDLAMDNENVIYVSYSQGVKIYDGSRWQSLIIPDTFLTRKLYFDGVDRVYVGGFDFIGYIKKNIYGNYEFLNLTPNDKLSSFASIWGITACENYIYFNALNHVIAYDPKTEDVRFWAFESKLAGLTCINNKIVIQDRTVGLKVLQDNQWVDSDIKPQDNSMIEKIELLSDDRFFFRSKNDSWRIFQDDEIQNIQFKNHSQLPALTSYNASTRIDQNHLVMGNKIGLITFFDFENMTYETFKLSNDWISDIIKTNDGGILILSNFKIYHLTWPTPWRIQKSKSGLSSDIYNISYWSGLLYAMSPAGVFVEDSEQNLMTHQQFKHLNYTDQEAWHLLPLSDQFALLASSFYIQLISQESNQIISDIIYPRHFTQSKFNPDHIFVYTEKDSRVLVKSETGWHNWVIYPDKTNSIIEISSNEILITTIDGGFYKVLLDFEQRKLASKENLKESLGLSEDIANDLYLFEGPDNKIFATNPSAYFEFVNQQFIPSDIYGLKDVLNPENLYGFYFDKKDGLWAHSETTLYRFNENRWQTINTKPFINGGIYGLAFSKDMVKISANSMILSFYLNQEKDSHQPVGSMIITTAAILMDDQSTINLPLLSDESYSVPSNARDLTVHYSFTDHKNKAHTEYQYRLKGLNDQWSSYDHSTQAKFIELPAGHYSFEVRAKDISGRVHISNPIMFEILPEWYLSRTAIYIWVLLIIGIVFLLIKILIKWREGFHQNQKLALEATITEKTQALKLANQALQDLAHKDSLTGLSNRLFLDKFINKLIRERVENIAIMMLDIDHFKNFNDSNGHLAGDQLLESFSKLLMSHINSKQDLISRYGGEEFLAIFPNPNYKYILALAENIRKSTEQHLNGVTISIGLAFSESKTSVTNAKEVFKLIDQADQALYAAKTNGRNQVSIFNKEKQMVKD